MNMSVAMCQREQVSLQNAIEQGNAGGGFPAAEEVFTSVDPLQGPGRGLSNMITRSYVL